MKYLLLFLLGLWSLSLSAQEKKQKWILNGVYVGSVVLNGIGDGLKDSGHKEWGHFANAVSISFLLVSPFIHDYSKDTWWKPIIKYGFIRVGLFDWTYNTTRGLPLTYYGSTSFWDKNVMQKVNAPYGFAAGRVVFTTIGFVMPVTKIKRDIPLKIH